MEPIFYTMIKTLRETEDVNLHSDLLSVSESDKDKVLVFLREEYVRESLNYPHSIPDFHGESALKSAEFIYMVAQFILYRKNDEEELEQLLPHLDFEVKAETILSIDLCLRFLPDMIVSLKAIDSEDLLISILEKTLTQWHYSGVNYALEVSEEAIEVAFSNACVKQLYIDRIVYYKQRKLAQQPEINTLLLSSMGMYLEEYWPDFKLISENE